MSDYCELTAATDRTDRHGPRPKVTRLCCSIKKVKRRSKAWKCRFVSDSQDSEVFEAGKVVLADDRQVVSVQVAEKTKQQRTGDVREQEVNHGRGLG